MRSAVVCAKLIQVTSAVPDISWNGSGSRPRLAGPDTCLPNFVYVEPWHRQRKICEALFQLALAGGKCVFRGFDLCERSMQNAAIPCGVRLRNGGHERSRTSDPYSVKVDRT